MTTCPRFERNPSLKGGSARSHALKCPSSSTRMGRWFAYLLWGENWTHSAPATRRIPQSRRIKARNRVAGFRPSQKLLCVTLRMVARRAGDLVFSALTFLREAPGKIPHMRRAANSFLSPKYSPPKVRTLHISLRFPSQRPRLDNAWGSLRQVPFSVYWLSRLESTPTHSINRLISLKLRGVAVLLLLVFPQ